MKNMGKTDRIIRLTLGIILIAAAVILQITTGQLWWLGLIGIVLAGTSAIAFCPLYLPFKINTNTQS